MLTYNVIYPSSLPPKLKDSSCESSSTQQDSSEEVIPSKQTTDIVIIEEEDPWLDSKASDDKTTDSITEEWEQLIVNEIPKINSLEEAIPLKQATDIVVREEELQQLEPKAREDKTTAHITEEWEQLIVNEIPNRYSPTCIAKPKFDQPVLSLPESNRHLDEKTSRILERLEVPRQLRKKVASPIISSSAATEAPALSKKPLIPFGPSHAADQGTVASQSSQPMKPNFQRLKRKLR